MRFTTAIAVSGLVHAALAAALAVWLGRGGAADVSATLDVSSVELSFAEEDDSTAEASFVPPSVPSKAVAPAPREPDLPVPDEPVDLPGMPTATMPPSPATELERFETPVAPAAESAPVPDAAPRQAKVDAPPRPAASIRPDYPRGPRQRGEQGDVTLEMRIGATGAVEDVRVAGSSGHSELDEAAVRAVRMARFVPAKSGGEAVSSTARITLTFRLK
ncbi:MAG: TonB family protein [Kiritimatiellae bacterium]|nr:TonB family protein [Kiritimatiellia bacterium]